MKPTFLKSHSRSLTQFAFEIVFGALIGETGGVRRYFLSFFYSFFRIAEVVSQNVLLLTEGFLVEGVLSVALVVSRSRCEKSKKRRNVYFFKDHIKYVMLPLEIFKGNRNCENGERLGTQSGGEGHKKIKKKPISSECTVKRNAIRGVTLK